MSRLSIEIEPEQHRQIKTLASYEGMTIKEFILKKTLAADEEEMDTTEMLLSSPTNRARLMESLNSPKELRRVFSSIEEFENEFGI